MRGERQDRGLRQDRTERKGHVRRVAHLKHRQRHGARQALAAVIRVASQPVPSAFDEGAIGLDETRRGDHATILKARADAVAVPVQRRQDSVSKIRRSLQDSVQRLGVDVRVEGAQTLKPRDTGQGESEIADWSVEAHLYSCA